MKPILFYDRSFPYAGPRLDEQTIARLRQHFVITDAECLAETLAQGENRAYVHLHGPFFPKAAWKAIIQHLRRGNGFVYAGGAPFRIPVVSRDGKWQVEREQTAYHQQLNIHEALHINGSRINTLTHDKNIPLLAKYESLFDIQDTYGLVMHATKASDHPHELGSSGPMDAHLYPLLRGISKSGKFVAAPAILIENTKGTFAGGRWLFIHMHLPERFWEEGVQALADCASFVQRGVTEIWLKPGYASYEPGEGPLITLQLQSLRAGGAARWEAEISVEYEGEAIYSKRTEISVGHELTFWRESLPIVVKPGFYTVSCTLKSEWGEKRILHQGFWGMDRELLARGSRLQCGRDYFVRDGKPVPIVGMTYMASDVARKFLFLPNVAVWERDMSQMKRAGINLIRTGIWTAWRHVAFVDGHASEEVMRAIDAFILTARRFELEVTFNFFSFTPESWEGVNPYLDPRSVEAQKRFILAVVSRHKHTKNVHWDLINEPTMFDPQRVFQGPRTCHDPFEHAAYVEWLQKRHGTIETLQERWNMTPEELPNFDCVRLPEPDDINFHIQDVMQPKKGLVWLDYCLFTMEMHNRWASELTNAIRSVQPEHLVTVGQDEALPKQRPSPLFYAEAVDYTTVHSWWQMDDLLWDGIFTKDPLKPNLVQETGIMYVEDANGRARRSEEELRNILERKYAYAFAAGSAGAVQWIWNINFYMDNINESNIGALRADGSEKPEADVSYDFGAFIEEIGEYFTERKLEEIVVIYPYSNDFSNRSFARESTTRLTRVLAYELKLSFRAASEYHLHRLPENERPKLYIVPSAHTTRDEAVSWLLNDIVEHGGTLLITGPVSIDEYWHRSERLRDILGDTMLAHIMREERLEIDGAPYLASYGGTRIADAWKEIKEIPQQQNLRAAGVAADRVEIVQVGRGSFIWCPLPLELNERSDVLLAMYRFAAEKAGVKREIEWLQGGDLPGVYGRKLEYAAGSLYVFVSEFGHDASICIRDRKTQTKYSFLLPRERSVLFFTDQEGRVKAVYRPHEVTIATE